MLLAVDVGNTNVTVGAFEGERLLGLWRLATDARKTADEYGLSLKALLSSTGRGVPKAAVLGSVVPDLSPVLSAALRDHLGVRPLEVSARGLGVPLRVDRPSEVGVDRVLNALAVIELYGAPAVVVDFGTATTFDCVSARGEYLGGAILIGPGLAARALAERTAKLPLVEVKKPRRAIGKSTIECIQAGLYFGYLGMVERLLKETLREMGARPRPRVLATGGLAPLFARALPRVERVAPDLTLQGLRLAWESLAPRKQKYNRAGTSS